MLITSDVSRRGYQVPYGLAWPADDCRGYAIVRWTDTTQVTIVGEEGRHDTGLLLSPAAYPHTICIVMAPTIGGTSCLSLPSRRAGCLITMSAGHTASQ